MADSSPLQVIGRNLGWMLTSLFLALVVWVAATMANNPVEERELKGVEIVYEIPDGLVLVNQPALPQSVSVFIRTQQSEWGLLVPDDVTVTASLENVRAPGEYRVELEAEINSPRYGTVAAVRPSTLTLEVGAMAEARTPIEIVVRREPPLGYSYPSELVCDQTEVIVRGSADRVSSVRAAEVRMDLSDKRNPFTETFDLIPVNADGRTVTNVALSPSSVVCSVDIQAREDVTPIEVLPATTGSPPDGYVFEGYDAFSPRSVGVTGDRDAIARMNRVVRTAPIDLRGRTETFTVEVPVLLPDGVRLVPENQLISVTVRISPQINTRQYEGVPVIVTGLDEARYRVQGLASTVTVFVAGPQDRLPSADQVTVAVDLANLGTGNHQVRPQPLIDGEPAPPGLTLSVQPEELSLTLAPIDGLPTPTPTLPAGDMESIEVISPTPSVSAPAIEPPVEATPTSQP
ncbi:MAG: CdaR family protein [Chloroflexota bacterium]|jgi:YbbR domain-containing protein|nr:hypothetical protein [Anaerolineae bacterium]HMM29008.1 CdaR family protein [Aggregatilineaceae bacterium]